MNRSVDGSVNHKNGSVNCLVNSSERFTEPSGRFSELGEPSTERFTELTEPHSLVDCL